MTLNILVLLGLYFYGMIVLAVCERVFPGTRGMRLRDWIGTIVLGWFLVPIIAVVMGIGYLGDKIREHW